MKTRKKLRMDIIQFGKKFYKVDIFNEEGWETWDLNSDLREISPTEQQVNWYKNQSRFHHMSNIAIEEF